MLAISHLIGSNAILVNELAHVSGPLELRIQLPGVTAKKTAKPANDCGCLRTSPEFSSSTPNMSGRLWTNTDVSPAVFKTV